ncbi:MAG: diguanylate cyclase domain-containing protein [Chitinispirillaceae bacterium]
MKIPEFRKIVTTFGWRDKPAYRKLILNSILTGFNAVITCAAFLLPLQWYTVAPILSALIFWNWLLFASFHRQLEKDEKIIRKNGTLFRRFQNTAKYFESILQDTTDIIISLDKDNFIFKFNNGAQNHFGYSQEEILGVPFENLFINPEDKEKFHKPISSGCKSISAEVPMKTKSGQKIIVNMCISKMKDGGCVVTAQDITEKKKLEEVLKEKNEQLKKLAITDNLTGLYNCRHFYTTMKGELSRLKRYPGRKLAVIYIDVDRFKEFNDSEGHQMGDHVLRSLGKVIDVCIRKDVDAGFRYGGDEFVIILPDTDMHEAKVAAKRIQKQFGAFRFGQTSLSIGIADALPEDDEKTLVRRADFAMYKSKKQGKAKIILAEQNRDSAAYAGNT